MDLSSMIIGFLVSIVGLIIILIKNKIDASEKERLILSKIKKLDDFKVSKLIMGNDRKNGLAIDEARHKFCLIKQESEIISTKVYKYKDLLETEILEDGVSIIKTSRSSQLGGMLIGGLALGSVGAIIGGLSGKKNQVDTVSSIDLKLVVNDTKSPMFLINFLKSSDGYKKNGFIYKKNIQIAREWNSLMSVLIKRADEEDNNNINTANKENNNLFIADEISKLRKLFEEKLLTEKEFEQQKNKLLK